MDNKLQKMFFQNSLCLACEGAGYQSPPTFGAGSLDAKVLVIAQNPGRIKSSDKENLEKARKAAADVGEVRANECTTDDDIEFLSESISEWCMRSFSTSYGAKTLGLILGEDWLKSKEFFFTNAVRCRTLNNARPTKQMIDNCQVKWTNRLLTLPNFKTIITIGRIATDQVLSATALDKQTTFGSIYQISIDGKLTSFLSLPHYRVWRPLKIRLYRAAVQKLLREAKVEYTVT